MSATQDQSVTEHADRDHRLALNRRTAARCRKRKQNEVERLHVRIGALELANAALSGDQTVVSGPDNLGVPTTHAGHQASAIFTAYIAEGSASGIHHNCQAESLPTCTLECEDSDLCSDTSMAKAATFPNSIANIPTQPLPAPLFSRERDCVLAYSSQRNVAKHDSSTKFSTPAQMHTMASCQSAPASLLPQREQQLCHQQQHTSVGVKQPRRVTHSLPRHHTAPPTFTSGSHRAPGSIRRSTAGISCTRRVLSQKHSSLSVAPPPCCLFLLRPPLSALINCGPRLLSSPDSPSLGLLMHLHNQPSVLPFASPNNLFSPPSSWSPLHHALEHPPDVTKIFQGCQM
ncbi:hypothetical protein WJX82_006528 [Trebouxia sp. C0006]